MQYANYGKYEGGKYPNYGHYRREDAAVADAE
jgi:hypothetical protein